MNDFHGKSLILMGLVLTTSTAVSAAGNSSKTKKEDSKPKLMPWKSFGSKKEDERSYNIFKYNVSKPAAEITKPEDWRSFDPRFYSNKAKLIPDPAAIQGLGPLKYSTADFGGAQDPSKLGAIESAGSKTVFAHQGTPLSNGWLAPPAGYAYQVDGILVYGTTNYTPINYNGALKKFIGINRIPVSILSQNGDKQPLDLSRLVFAVNDNLLSKPQSIVYPSIIYLKPGETASIQGKGNVKCPAINQPEQFTLPTPNGEQSIKVMCSPDNPVIPGKISP